MGNGKRVPCASLHPRHRLLALRDADAHACTRSCTESAGHREQVVVSTKFGFRPPAGTGRHAFEVGYAFGELAVNGSPELVRGYALGSLRRLGAERLDLLSPHFPDPVVPIAETVGAIADLVQEGLVANVGVANVSAAQLAEAVAVCRIAAVQVEWSMWHRADP
ncbi:MAG TPA: aldo/keto reductase, partial [Burkholderiales bacterium]